MKLTLIKNKDGEPILREKNPYEKLKNEPNMDNVPVINPAWKLFESNVTAKPLIGEYPEGRTEFDSDEMESGIFQVENGKNVHTDLGKTIKGYDLVEGYRYKPVGADMPVKEFETIKKRFENGDYDIMDVILRGYFLGERNQSSPTPGELDIEKAASDKHLEIYRWLLGHYGFPEFDPKAKWVWRKDLLEKLEEIGIDKDLLNPKQS